MAEASQNPTPNPNPTPAGVDINPDGTTTPVTPPKITDNPEAMLALGSAVQAQRTQTAKEISEAWKNINPFRGASDRFMKVSFQVEPAQTVSGGLMSDINSMKTTSPTLQGTYQGRHFGEDLPAHIRDGGFVSWLQGGLGALGAIDGGSAYIPMAPGDTPESVLEKARGVYSTGRKRQAAYSLARFADVISFGALDHEGTEIDPEKFGGKPGEPLQMIPPGPLHEFTRKFQQDYPEFVQDAELMSLAASLLLFHKTPPGMLMRGIEPKATQAISSGFGRFLKSKAGQSVMGGFDAAVAGGTGKPKGMLDWIGRSWGARALAKADPRQVAAFEQRLEAAGGTFLDDGVLYVSRNTPEKEIQGIIDSLKSIRTNALGESFTAAPKVRIIYSEEMAARMGAANQLVSAAQLGGLSVASAGLTGAWTAGEAAKYRDPETQKEILKDLPKHLALGAAIPLAGAVAQAYPRTTAIAGATGVGALGVATSQGNLEDGKEIKSGDPTSISMLLTLAGMAMKGKKAPGDFTGKTLAPRPFRSYGHKGEAAQTARPGLPAPTGVATTPASARLFTSEPVRVTEPVAAAQNINRSLGELQAGAEAAIRGGTSTEGIARAAAGISAASRVLQPTENAAMGGVVPPLQARVDAASSLLGAIGRVGPDRLSHVDRILGYTPESVLSMTGGDPTVTQVIAGQVEYAAGLFDELLRSRSYIPPDKATDLDRLLSLPLGGEENTALALTQPPNLAAVNARLAQVARILKAEVPGAKVGPPPSLRSALSVNLPEEPMPVIDITPPKGLPIPDFTDLDPELAPDAEAFKQNPEEAQMALPLHLASNSSWFTHEAGRIKFKNPSVLTSTESEDLPVTITGEGAILVHLPSDRSSMEGGEAVADVTNGFPPGLLNALAEPYFEPSSIAPTALKMDPELERFVVDKDETGTRELQRKIWAQHRVPEEVQQSANPFKDPVAFARTILSTNPSSTREIDAMRQHVNILRRQHEAKTPSRQLALNFNGMMPDSISPEMKNHLIDREHSSLLQDHAAMGSLIEATDDYLQDWRKVIETERTPEEAEALASSPPLTTTNQFGETTSTSRLLAGMAEKVELPVDLTQFGGKAPEPRKGLTAKDFPSRLLLVERGGGKNKGWPTVWKKTHKEPFGGLPLVAGLGTLLHPTTESTPEGEEKRFTDVLTDLVGTRLKEEGREECGATWYVEDIANTVAGVSRVTGAAPMTQNRQVLFRYLLAALSNGTSVQDNLDQAVYAYLGYLKTGSIPLYGPYQSGSWGSVRDNQKKQGLMKLQAIIDFSRSKAKMAKIGRKPGLGEMFDFLHTPLPLGSPSNPAPGTVRYFERLLKESQGEQWKTSSIPVVADSPKALSYPALTFGPKLGVFALNMNGIMEIPTIDAWMKYMWMVVQGSMDTTISPKGKEVPDQTLPATLRRRIWKSIQDAAKNVGVTPAEIQSVAWISFINLVRKAGVKQATPGRYIDAISDYHSRIDVAGLDPVGFTAARAGRHDLFERVKAARAAARRRGPVSTERVRGGGGPATPLQRIASYSRQPDDDAPAGERWDEAGLELPGKGDPKKREPRYAYPEVTSRPDPEELQAQAERDTWDIHLHRGTFDSSKEPLNKPLTGLTERISSLSPDDGSSPRFGPDDYRGFKEDLPYAPLIFLDHRRNVPKYPWTVPKADSIDVAMRKQQIARARFAEDYPKRSYFYEEDYPWEKREEPVRALKYGFKCVIPASEVVTSEEMGKRTREKLGVIEGTNMIPVESKPGDVGQMFQGIDLVTAAEKMAAEEGLALRAQKDDVTEGQGIVAVFRPVRTLEDASEEIVNSTLQNGGITFSVARGSAFDSSTWNHPHAWAVGSAREGRGMIIPKDEFNEEHVFQFIRRNKDVLGSQNVYLGTWLNPATNNVEMDPSTVDPDFNSALATAQARGEKAIFDLKTFKTVNVPVTDPSVKKPARVQSMSPQEEWVTIIPRLGGQNPEEQAKALRTVTAQSAGDQRAPLKGAARELMQNAGDAAVILKKVYRAAGVRGDEFVPTVDIQTQILRPAAGYGTVKRARIVVRDNGVGVPHDRIQKMIDPLVSHLKGTETGGSFGIGMSGVLAGSKEFTIVTRALPQKVIVVPNTPADIKKAVERNRAAGLALASKYVRKLDSAAAELTFVNPIGQVTETIVKGTGDGIRNLEGVQQSPPKVVNEAPGTTVSVEFKVEKTEGGKYPYDHQLGASEAEKLLRLSVNSQESLPFKLNVGDAWNIEAEDAPEDMNKRFDDLKLSIVTPSDYQMITSVLEPDEALQKEQLNKPVTMETPWYSADFHTSKLKERGRSVSLLVQVNGLPQFIQTVAIAGFNDPTREIPAKTILNFRTKVDGSDPNYPISQDRESIRPGHTSDITRFIMHSILSSAIQAEIAALKSVFEGHLFPGENVLRLMNPQPAYSKWEGNIRNWSKSPEYHSLASALRFLMETQVDQFYRFYNNPLALRQGISRTTEKEEMSLNRVEFGGLTTHAGAYGVNFLTSKIYDDPSRKNTIFLNPWAIWDTYYQADEATRPSYEKDRQATVSQVVAREAEYLGLTQPLTEEQVLDIKTRLFADHLAETLSHEVQHQWGRDESSVKEISDGGRSFFAKFHNSWATHLYNTLKENDYAIARTIEADSQNYRVERNEARKADEAALAEYGTSRKPQRLDFDEFGSFSRERKWGNLGRPPQSAEGGDRPEGDVRGGDKNLSESDVAGVGPSGSQPPEQRSVLRKEALAWMAAGKTWSRAPGPKLFNALTDQEKFQAVLSRIISGKIANARNLEFLNPERWSRKKPKYFGTWVPTQKQLNEFKAAYVQRRKAWTLVQEAEKKGKVRAKTIAASRKKNKVTTPRGMPEFSDEELLAFNGEELDNILEKDPLLFDDLVRAFWKRADPITETIENLPDTAAREEMFLKMNLVKDLFREMGDKRRDAGPHPTDKTRDPGSGITRLIADMNYKLKQLAKQPRWMARPMGVVGPRKQLPHPKDIGKAHKSGEVSTNPWYELTKAETRRANQIKEFFSKYNLILQMAARDPELDKRIFQMMREFSTAEAPSELERPEWNNLKVPVGLARNYGIVDTRRTINLKDIYPKLREDLNNIITEAEDAETFTLNTEAGQLDSNVRFIEKELRARELAFAKELDDAITEWEDIVNIHGEEFLEDIRSDLNDTDEGKPDGEEVGYINGEPHNFAPMPYKMLFKRWQTERARLKKVRKRVQGIKDGSLRRQGYIPYIHQMTLDEVRRELSNPESQFGMYTSPKVKTRFLEERSSDSEPLHSFVTAMYLYIPAMAKMINLQPAVTRVMSKINQLPVDQRLYTLQWIDVLRGKQAPVDTLLNRMGYQSFVHEQNLIDAGAKALGFDLPKLTREMQKTGHIQPNAWSRQRSALTSLTYLTLLSSETVARLTGTEFAFWAYELMKNPADLLPAAIWGPKGLLKSGVQGAREVGSWLKSKTTGAPRYYSDATLAQVVDIVHEMNEFAGAQQKASGGGLNSLLRKAGFIYFMPLKAAEFMLRAATFETLKSRMKWHNPDMDEEEIIFWAAAQTNDLIGAYGKKDVSPLMNNSFIRWWAMFKRWTMGKIEHAANAGSGGMEAIGHGMHSLTGSDRFGRQFPERSVSGEGASMGMIPPPPSPPDIPGGGGGGPQPPDEADAYRRSHLADAPMYGANFPAGRNPSMRLLMQLLFGSMGTFAGLYVLGQLMFRDNPDDMTWSRLFPFGGLSEWNNIPATALVSMYMKYLELWTRGELVGHTPRTLRDMEKAKNDLITGIPMLRKTLREQAQHKRDMMAAAGTGRLLQRTKPRLHIPGGPLTRNFRENRVVKPGLLDPIRKALTLPKGSKKKDGPKPEETQNE